MAETSDILGLYFCCQSLEYIIYEYHVMLHAMPDNSHELRMLVLAHQLAGCLEDVEVAGSLMKLQMRWGRTKL